MKRTEVFIAYDPAVDSIHQLGQTLNAWDLPDYEPVAIEVKNANREKLRRIAAEGLAKGDYIIAELGSKPSDLPSVVDPLGKGNCQWYGKGKGSIKVEACPERIQ